MLVLVLVLALALVLVLVLALALVLVLVLVLAGLVWFWFWLAPAFPPPSSVPDLSISRLQPAAAAPPPKEEAKEAPPPKRTSSGYGQQKSEDRKPLVSCAQPFAWESCRRRVRFASRERMLPTRHPVSAQD